MACSLHIFKRKFIDILLGILLHISLMAPPSPAMALRESFGDRSLPDISRKITACVACRKQKIKCHMNNSNPPCSRCRIRGLPCTVNKSLQMLLENDVGDKYRWKEGMEQRMRKIEEALRLGSNQQHSSPSATLDAQDSPPMAPGSTTENIRPEFNPSDRQSEPAGKVSLNLACSLGSFPGSSIITLTFTEHGAHSGYKPDLVSCGLISLEAAEEYFKVYHGSLDPCIHQVLARDNCLANIRARSSLLTAAICTVGSFCTASADYQKCYDAFIDEVSSKVFSRNPSFDDVRALCIGAFWLNKVSSTLISLAVRMAVDLNLHRCITKMPHKKKRECYERTHLYFLVYICDHHCSLIYGKPPMTREFRSLKSPKAFLQSEFSTAEDVKLIGQVDLWSTSSCIFDIFGADTKASIANQRAAELDALNRAFSRQMFDLYAYSAKLYLFSHTFRGASQRHAKLSINSNGGIERFERRALESALFIVRSVAQEDKIQRCLEKLPSYFGTMIAFASVSLIKAWGQEPTMCGIDKNEVSNVLSQLVNVFRACSPRVHSNHPLLSIAKSLEKFMNERPQLVNNSDGGHTTESLDNTLFAFDNIGGNSSVLEYLGDQNDLSTNPNELSFDLDYHGDHDILSTNTNQFSFDLFGLNNH